MKGVLISCNAVSERTGGTAIAPIYASEVLNIPVLCNIQLKRFYTPLITPSYYREDFDFSLLEGYDYVAWVSASDLCHSPTAKFTKKFESYAKSNPKQIHLLLVADEEDMVNPFVQHLFSLLPNTVILTISPYAREYFLTRFSVKDRAHRVTHITLAPKRRHLPSTQRLDRMLYLGRWVWYKYTDLLLKLAEDIPTDIYIGNWLKVSSEVSSIPHVRGYLPESEKFFVMSHYKVSFNFVRSPKVNRIKPYGFGDFIPRLEISTMESIRAGVYPILRKSTVPPEWLSYFPRLYNDSITSDDVRKLMIDYDHHWFEPLNNLLDYEIVQSRQRVIKTVEALL